MLVEMMTMVMIKIIIKMGLEAVVSGNMGAELYEQ